MTAKRLRFVRFWALLTVLNGIWALPNSDRCFYSCFSKCLNNGEKFDDCEVKCEEYRREDLCKEAECESRCRDLFNQSTQQPVSAPTNLRSELNPDGTLNLQWDSGVQTPLFLIEWRQLGSDWETSHNLISNESKIPNFSANGDQNCDSLDIRVSAISPDSGIGLFSEPLNISPPQPEVSSELSLQKLEFRPIPFRDSSSSSNGTLSIVLSYNVSHWPLGDADLEVTPLFHVVKCALTYEGILANPIFFKGEKEATIETSTSAEFMYHRCTVFYFVSEVRSRRCERSFKPAKMGAVSMRPTEINCNTVANSRCSHSNGNRHFPPECGFSSNFRYDLLNSDEIDWSNPNEKISVNITFEPITRRSRPRAPLYFTAFFGKAQTFANPQDVGLHSFERPHSAIEELLAGVNITQFIGNVSSCRHCLNKNSFILNDLTADTLYGVVICSVFDLHNLSFPQLKGYPKGIAPKAERILISSEKFKSPTPWFGILLSSAGFLSLLIIGVFIYLCWRERRREVFKSKLEFTHSNGKTEYRYTDLPKSGDIWELERRNLVINEEDRLGSGAFGAVYKGRLIGTAKGSHNAQSPLGVNIMRAENCDVAIKMLPDYADDLCKAEFLREIALMKTLGYHERLVNMLACVTTSEPYYLVVEFCSDGDLLHFLKKRCDYMMELDEKQIDYGDPNCDVEFDRDLVMTVKELLMFAVQISFGLEYIAQKGFVHRDNVLVHDRHYAKVGDFGLCRPVNTDDGQYQSKGGRLPVKWMSPEAIRHYQFTDKSDVWSFGVLMFEIITLGGGPYPGINPEDILMLLDSGHRMQKPDNCPDEFYEIMFSCWSSNPKDRPSFSTIRQQLAHQLEAISDEYSYLKLDAQKDYYLLCNDHDVKEEWEKKSLEPTLSNPSNRSLQTPDSSSTLIRPNNSTRDLSTNL